MFEETEDDDEPQLLSFLESRTIAALVTVCIGGIFTTCIASSVQRTAKERDLATAQLRDIAAHRLSAQKSFLDEQRTAVDQAYRLVGRMRSASMGLLDTMSPDFADETFPSGSRRAVIEQQREKLRVEFNAADDAWHYESATFGYLLSDYPSQSTGVAQAWSDTRRAVDTLRICAETRYRKWVQDGKSLPSECVEEDSSVGSSMDRLSDALRYARSRARWEWENALPLVINNQREN